MFLSNPFISRRVFDQEGPDQPVLCADPFPRHEPSDVQPKRLATGVPGEPCCSDSQCIPTRFTKVRATFSSNSFLLLFKSFYIYVSYKNDSLLRFFFKTDCIL